MEYADIVHFAASWGLIFTGIVFVGVLVHALRPRNRRKFERAARIPLED